MSNRVGNYREFRVRDHLVSHGWLHIMKAGGSHGAADLFLAHPEHGGALVQVGGASKTLGPADRERLLHAAHLAGALPILAVVVPRQPIRYWQVGEGTPGTWDEWSPA